MERQLPVWLERCVQGALLSLTRVSPCNLILLWAEVLFIISKELPYSSQDKSPPRLLPGSGFEFYRCWA